ncbi:MAG: hypothetical protein AB7H97_08250 [Pseudobdellovibrionaceae bacterium]
MTIPKLTVSNYPEMLRKLSAAAFFVTLACVSVLRAKIESINTLLNALDISTDIRVVGPVEFPLGTVIVAALVAFVSEAIRLHDKVSDWLKIRAEFDLRFILIPAALMSGASLNWAQFGKLRSDRTRMMGEVFYEYASSSSGKAAIDPHAISQALTTWSWYWLCVEAIVLLLVTSAFFAVEGQYPTLAAILASILALLMLMGVFKSDCGRYADSQVRQVLSDESRKAAIAAKFNAL